MQPPALRVLVQPRPQPRPLAQQRLVRDLDGAVGDRQQAAVGEPLRDLGELRLEAVERDPPAHDGAVRTLVAQPQQEPARRRLGGRVEREERVLRQPGDRALDAAASRVGGEPQVPPVARAPQLEQRRREQRQGAWLVLDVAQQRVDQLGLDAQPDPLGGALDRAPQLLARHRAHQHVVGADQARQLRISGAAPVEVGAHREHDGGVRSHEQIDEPGPLVLVTAGREQLLELIDHQKAPSLAAESLGRAPQLAQRLLAGADQRLRPVVAAGQHAARQRRQQPGSDHGGLAAARRADDGEQRRADEPRDQLGDEPLAPEEVRGVVGVEGRQPLVRAGDRRLIVLRRETLADDLELGDAAGEVGLERPRLAAA